MAETASVRNVEGVKVRGEETSLPPAPVLPPWPCLITSLPLLFDFRFIQSIVCIFFPGVFHGHLNLQHCGVRSPLSFYKQLRYLKRHLLEI